MAETENRLTLTREISRSGIATVWEAYDAGLDRKVLLKTIHPQYARESDLRARFEREARAIARLSHPNVVHIYDLRASGDELSIILEFVEGVSLGRLLKDHGELPTEIAVTVAAEILAGLEQAHAAGIVHRDLKPDNVLVSERGEVKITDFGLASLRDQPTVTQEGMVVGTPSYMAPEQATGGEIGPGTDLFAVGLILFEMLTGRRLIEGESLGEAFQSVLKYSHPKLEPYREHIPEAVEPVLRKLLEKQPDKRFHSAGEARAALIHTQPDGLLPRVLIADFLSGEPVRHAAVKRAARAKSHALQVTMTVALILAAGGVAMYLLRSGRQVVTQTSTVDSLAAVRTPTTGDSSRTVASGGQPADSLIAQVPEPKTGGEHTGPKENRIIEPPPVSPPIKHEPGQLEITTRPWASVYIGDSLWGTTPLAQPLRLLPGNYDLVLLNPEIGFPVTRKISIEPGEQADLRVNLYDAVARIRVASVKPWADVYVDGKLELRTPSSRTIFRPLGTHTITLKHPDYPIYTTEVSFKPSDPIFEVRVDLTRL
jgi:serine/threonine protein kinase